MRCIWAVCTGIPKVAAVPSGFPLKPKNGYPKKQKTTLVTSVLDKLVIAGFLASEQALSLFQAGS